MYSLARPFLFSLDAERAHDLTLELFRRAPQLATAPFARAAVDDLTCERTRVPLRIQSASF